MLADHALAGVDAVTVGGKAIAGWRWYNGADITGHACAFLELSQPPASGATLAAEVRGLSGNPAAILADLYPVSYTHLDVYKRQPMRWLLSGKSKGRWLKN